MMMTLSKRIKADFLPHILLICILTLGTFTRFYKIDERCLYPDSLMTINIISQSSLHEIWSTVTDKFRPDPPLYYIILHYWGLISKSVFWLRAFSAICGALLVLVAYKLVKYLFNRKTALLTAYFVAISPLLVLYSQVIRYNSLNSLLNLLSLYFFIKALRSNRIFGWSGWAAYTGIRSISLWINYSALIFFFSEAIFILLFRKKYSLSFRRWLACFLIITAAFVPMGQYLIRNFSILLSGEGFRHIPLKSGWIANILYFFFTFSLGKTISPFNYTVISAAVILYLAILIKFFKTYRAKLLSNESIVFVLLSLMIAVILCAFSEYNSPRYIKSASVLYVIILSLGILRFPKKTAVILVIALSLLSFYSLSNLYNGRQYHRRELVDHWDDIAAYVHDYSEKLDIVIYNGHPFAYYFGLSDPDKTALVLPETEEEMILLIKENLETRKSTPRIIFVYSPLSGLKINDYKDEIALLQNWLNRNHFKLIAQENFDQDRQAHLKRKFVNRTFPEYRTSVYIYSRE